MIRNDTLKLLRNSLGLSQAALADRLRVYLEAAGVAAAPDARLVAAWERGEIKWPQRHYREALRAILGVGSDAACGFAPRSARSRRLGRAFVLEMSYDAEDENEVRRSSFLRGIVAIAFAATDTEPLQTWLGVEPSRVIRPSSIGMADVEAVERTTSQFATWDTTHGGLLFVDAVFGQLNGAATLLDRGRFASSAVRGAMARAVGNLAAIAGWCAYDAGQHLDARRAMALGVHAAAEGDDWALRAAVMADLARQSITLGDPRGALDLLAAAHFGARPVATPPTLAMLHVVSARAYGRSGASRECLRHVQQAEEIWVHPGPDDPVWIRYYTPAQLAGDGGCALFEAALLDQKMRQPALERLTRSDYGPDYPRSAALVKARASSLWFDAGEPERAVAEGQHFCQLSSAIKSARLTKDGRMLRGHARPYGRIPGVEELDHELSIGGPDV